MKKTPKIYKLVDTIVCNLESAARIAKTQAYRHFEENKDIHITFHEFIILDALYTNPKVHQRDLAKILYRGTANLSRDLEKLEKRGLIERFVDTRGKRVVKTLILTPEGEKTFQDVGEKIHFRLTEIENVFTPEEHQQFIDFIVRLRNRLTEAEDMFYE